MGGDLGPAVVVTAVLSVLQEDPLLSVDLFGDEAELAGMIRSAGLSFSGESRLQLHHAPQTVLMTDAPVQAFRQKNDSSMRLALQSVQDGHATAVVSTGNTGALVVMAHQLLGMREGIERPAMCTMLPTPQAYTLLLDVGAAIDVTPALLVQHAQLGAALAKQLGMADCPSVGLLNVGVEAGKGPAYLRDADQLLRDSQGFAYHGFVEGGDLFAGHVDVIVTDGFTGNVALKASEGVARLISVKAKRFFSQHAVLAAVLGMLRKGLAPLRDELDPEHFNGACLLGVKGIVVKSHGASSATGVAQSIRLAARLARSMVSPVQ